MPVRSGEGVDAAEDSVEGADAVGRVAGTEDATPLVFRVAVRPEAYLQLDDVVVTSREVPGTGPVTVAGVVTEVTARHEGAQFASDVFLISDGVLPAQVQETAEIATTRTEPEVWVPPRPGAAVYRAVDEERDRALCFDRMDRKVPVGLGRDGLPVYVDLDFLDGSRGAHVSISGISGVATKTSFALFLLHALFRSGVLGKRATNAKALVFSVKGEDLLFLDAPNNRLDDGDARKKYERLELPAEPFRSVAFFAPPRPGDLTGRPNVSGRTDGVGAFWWTIAEFCQQELLQYVFADVEDERNQYTMVVHQVATRLRTQGTAAGTDGAWSVDGRLLRTYDELVEFVVEKVTGEDSRWEWAGPAVGTGTVNAFVRRLRSSLKPIRPLVRADLSGARRLISTDGQQVTVVDLHSLPDRGQRFVVGVVLRAETERKEAAGPGGLLFTMLDELNKYAPREGSSPIKELVLDIAERGRSLGIILIGAQQTASEVERRVIANSAIKVVGRLDPAEAGRPEYGFLPASQRLRATLATPGAMFVSQPGIPVPLAVEFPFPAWATRQSERGGPPAEVPGGVEDPFDLLPDDDPPPF
jgi:DNA helicase HerA-like ATPase